MDTLSTVEVCHLTGVTYRQLDYWCRNGLVAPRVQARGSGSRRQWADVDVERVRRLQLASRLANRTLVECLDALEELVV